MSHTFLLGTGVGFLFLAQ